MVNFHSEYKGALRTSVIHEPSQTQLITDAPVDNHGKGESFSPTDLVATALGSCIVTIMGIIAQREGWSLEGLTWETSKIMTPPPRRIQEIIVNIKLENHSLTEEQKQKLETAGRKCPVALTLSPEVKQTLVFEW